MKPIYIILVVLFLASCKSDKKDITKATEALTAKEIVDKSIEVSGGQQFKKSSIAFKFRDQFYTALRRGGDFSLGRIKVLEGDSMVDILSNDGFARFINNEFQKIPDSMGQKYAASVNSVHYFSVLPFGLNDAAVKKRLLGDENIKGQNYYKIEVTFDQNGGGEDYEDVFIYWINKKNFKADYLAYSYAEDHGVGLRFREAHNERFIEGLRFVDYKNYKPRTNKTQLNDLGVSFNQGGLDLLSEINLEEIQVKLLNLE